MLQVQNHETCVFLPVSRTMNMVFVNYFEISIAFHTRLMANVNGFLEILRLFKVFEFLLNFPIKLKTYCPYFANLFSIYQFWGMGGINKFENCYYLVNGKK